MTYGYLKCPELTNGGVPILAKYCLIRPAAVPSVVMLLPYIADCLTTEVTLHKIR
jgi:hypothetical protein